MLNEEFKEPIPLADFELLAPIGEGGTGQVWRALHRSSHQEVAVKVLNRTAANNPTARASFRREVRAVARLSHPAVVLIYDHGLVDRAAERL